MLDLHGAFDLEQNDDLGFVRIVQPIVAGVLKVIAPSEVYLVKVDNWFGPSWLGFSHKALGVLGVQHRHTLRVPPFVPARIRSQRLLRYQSMTGTNEQARWKRANLHIAQQGTANDARLMSRVCPNAAVFWLSGHSGTNQRGCLMSYLPTDDGHTGWYAGFRQTDRWRVADTVCTTANELSNYADGIQLNSQDNNGI